MINLCKNEQLHIKLFMVDLLSHPFAAFGFSQTSGLISSAASQDPLPDQFSPGMIDVAGSYTVHRSSRAKFALCERTWEKSHG